MNILAITRHDALIERLRAAFESSGHQVHWVSDHLQALVTEAWNQAHVILVDASGDPLDGYRFCMLLRGESRVLFQNLPIFLVMDHPPTAEEERRLWDMGADGFILAGDGLQKLLSHLGPALEGGQSRTGGPPIPVLACGLGAGVMRKARAVLEHFGYDLQAADAEMLPEAQRSLKAPLMLLGLAGDGEGALSVLQGMRDHDYRPYAILMGRTPSEALMRRLLLLGAREILPATLSPSRLLHACRRGMEWLHVKRIQHEFQMHLNDLRDRRVLLEMETATLRTEVLTDPMTELLNRRAFNQHLEHAHRQWERHRRPFVLILGDLDYFKLINDRFGHLVGDQVLRAVAMRVKGALRRSDLAFRIGGEEFAILLAETGIVAGMEVAEKIRARIDEDPIVLAEGQTIFPTMSFGVGAPNGQDVANLFLAVDEALYAAKHYGRNRIEMAKSRS
ncbi:GGDEF domain-containing protein [Holophaga foetida]|uniref:GGDEF domain-containing protein n=1 Tax=Holophaga foetida TaxID=35839 RepID=UPI00024749B1|nr:diguanylate cyclase [Holophaga foetida]